MKNRWMENWRVFLGVGILSSSLVASPLVQAELVLDEEIETSSSEGSVEESESAEEIDRMSQSELVRKKRMRQEVLNEDLLQVRLEELRLREEQARTEKILKGKQEKEEEKKEAQEAKMAEPPVEKSTTVQVVSVGQPTPIESQLNANELEAERKEPKTLFSISPRVGFGVLNAESGYDVDSRFAAGAAAEAEVSDHFGFEVGYTYSEYGVSVNATNPYVQSYQNYTGYYNTSFDSVVMKQNLIDANLKLYVLGRNSRIRPFISGGAAYSKSYINYDQNIINDLRAAGLSNLAQDYETSSFLGSLGAGLKIELTKNFSISGLFKYYGVLTSNESAPLNNAVLYGNTYPTYYGAYRPRYLINDADKQAAGGSLARSNFYTITTGVSFTF